LFYGRVLQKCLMNGTAPGAPDARSFEQCMANVLASDAELQQLSTADAAKMLARATPPAPTITLSANPTTVAVNARSTLTWSSNNATDCTASDAWDGNKPGAGTQSIGPLSNNSTFTLSWTGVGGSAVSSRTVTVTAGGGPGYVASTGDSGGGLLDLAGVATLFALYSAAGVA
jgi:hypothetical protein